MDLPISKSKKRQNRRRKLRESRRESGEEADEEEAGYSHANEGESDTQDLSFDLAIPAITFKFNKAASRARVDSLYPLYDSSCASSPSKTVNDVQSNVARSIDTQLDPSIEGELLMTPPPSATLGSMQPHNSGPQRASLFAGSPSTDDENTDEDQPSMMTELSMAPTPDISPVLVPSVVPGLPSVSIIEPDHVARPFAVVSATFEDPLPRSPVSTFDDITAAAATATVPLPASPDKDTEIETIAFSHVPPSFEAEEGKDSQPTLVQESLPTIATSSLPPLPPFAAPGSSHVVTPPATSNIPLPPPPPPFISASGAAAAATATAPAPVVTPSVDNTSGIPPPPPPPPSPGLTGLKKSGPRTPLQISTSIMTTLDSHPPVHGPSLTAPLTPTRSIVARHVLRWDALSHGDISQTVFDTDHHHHHSRHRRHHGHGHRGHIRQASTVPNTPTSLKSPDFLCLDGSKGLDQYVLTDGNAVDDDAPPGAEESSHGYLHGQPEGPLDGPLGPHQESGPGPIAPPLAIEMDFQKFEEMFCIDPVEEQKRLKAKEANAQAKVKPKEVTLLEVRRATNVSIGLSRLMKRYESFDALRSMVLALDINAPSPPPPPPSSSTSSALTALSSQSTLQPSPSHHSLPSLSNNSHRRIVTSPAVVHSSTRNGPMVTRPTSSPFPSPSMSIDSPPMKPVSTFTPPTSDHSATTPPPLATPPNRPSFQPSLLSIITAHPLFASISSAPPSPTLSTTVTNPSTGSYFSSRSETPVVYQQHLNLDDLLTLEPLLPNEKERNLLDVYQRQNKAEFLASETEAVQKLGMSERFMYAMSKPVFRPLPEPAVPSENLQWAKGPSSTLKGGFASLNLKGLGKSGVLAKLSSQLAGGAGGLASASAASPLAASATAEDEDPLLIDDYIFAAICMLRFDADLSSTETQVRELIEGCDALRMNENLKVLFLGVLKVGNMLNTIYGRKKPSWQQQTHLLSSAHPLSAPARTLHPARSMPNMNFSMKLGSAPHHHQPQQQGAAGFRLNSLLKLRDVRSLDNKSNLMHYLANMVANTNPELLTLPDQFAFLSKLEQYRTKETLDQVVEHQKTIRKLRAFKEKLERKVVAMEEAAFKMLTLKSIAASKDHGQEGDVDGESAEEHERTRKEQAEEQEKEIKNGRQVLAKLDKFLKDAQSRFDDLVDQIEHLDHSWRATAIYFGEKSAEDVDAPAFPSTAANSTYQQQQLQQQQMVNRMLTGPRKPPEEIFAVLHEFFRHFREAHLQNEDQLIKQRRQAASFARRSKNSSASSSSTSSTTTTTSSSSSTRTKTNNTPAGSSSKSTTFMSGLASRSAFAGL
ncbi:hypothetical protein BGZ91_001673 [Linnemannia elongata]|nr:hypothetical protein BGZ91_001673 [Linnemannia elongata]